MAFNIAQYVRQQYELQQRNTQPMERERNEQSSTQHLISTPESSTEVHNSYDSTVRIVQPNQPINEQPSNVRLSNVAQANEGGNTVQQTTSSDNDDEKINILQAATLYKGFYKGYIQWLIIGTACGIAHFDMQHFLLDGNYTVTAALLSMVLYICAISLVIYGSIHFNECPAQKMITITYIVMGCLMLVSRLLSSPEECRNIFKKESNPQFVPQDICRWCLNLIIQLATMCFFFALCYWAFHIHPDTKEGSPNYCEKELYKNTYYACIVALAILGFGFVLTCCGACCVVCAVIKANE